MSNDIPSGTLTAGEKQPTMRVTGLDPLIPSRAPLVHQPDSRRADSA